MLVKQARAVDSSFTHIHAIASDTMSQYDKYGLRKRDYAWGHLKLFRGPQ